MDEKERARALDLALSQIEKQFGKGSILRLGSKDAIVPVSVISTGSISLDAALGVGGFPRGRINEIFGPESSGKTTIALQVIAEAQKAGGMAAFIDVEHALDPGYSKKLGVDIDNLLVSQPDYNRGLKIQGFRHHLLARLKPRADFLLLGWGARKHFAGHHFHAPEAAMFHGCVYPIAVVQMQHRGGWNRCEGFSFWAVEGGGGKHAESHHPRIRNFQADLRRAQVGIEDGADIGDPAFKHLVRIRVQMNVRVLIEPDKGEVVLIDVAQNPHLRKVGDGKRIG